MAKRFLTINRIPVYMTPSEHGALITYRAPMMIDDDGDPRCYHPDSDSGRDALGCAGHAGHWWGVATDNGKPSGEPIVQGPKDPAPGFLVSTTAYEWSQFASSDPRRYVNAWDVAYIAVPPQIREQAPGIVLGCRVIARYKGRMVQAVVADIEPRLQIGEASPACARALGIDDNPRRGGCGLPWIDYEVYTGEPAVVNGTKYNLIPLHGK